MSCLVQRRRSWRSYSPRNRRRIGVRSASLCVPSFVWRSRRRTRDCAPLECSLPLACLARSPIATASARPAGVGCCLHGLPSRAVQTAPYTPHPSPCRQHPTLPTPPRADGTVCWTPSTPPPHLDPGIRAAPTAPGHVHLGHLTPLAHHVLSPHRIVPCAPEEPGA